MLSAEALTHDHVVHFYRDDAELADRVMVWLGETVEHGDAALLITTTEHRAALEAALDARGLGGACGQGAGALVWADAEDLVGQLLVDEALEHASFEASIAPLVRQVAAGGRVVHVFGEIVSVLWTDGQAQAAIELERLWNRLRTQLPFALFCAYPAALSHDAEAAGAFEQICAEHSGFIDAAPDTPYADVSRRFSAAPTAVRSARAFVAGTLSGWGRCDLGEDAALVVSELATNAIQHAQSDFTVALSRLDGAVRVVVGDRLQAPPRWRDCGVRDGHGRGLMVVDALTSHWGYERVPGGKLVWAQFSVAEDGRAPVTCSRSLDLLIHRAVPAAQQRCARE